MKSKYMKPVLRIETFSLTQSVAQSCGWDLGASYGRPLLNHPHGCAWEDESGDAIFVDANSACAMVWDIDSDVNGACFNAPTNPNQLFNS